jgi:hypothetical protein
MAKGSSEYVTYAQAAEKALGQAVGAQIDAELGQGSQRWADSKAAAAAYVEGLRAEAAAEKK